MKSEEGIEKVGMAYILQRSSPTMKMGVICSIAEK